MTNIVPRYRWVRYIESGYATYARFYRPDGSQPWVGIERPWMDADADGKRDRGVSRFLPGIYRCFRRKSYLNGGDGKRKYDVWQLKNVPDCTAAQLHRAAFPLDLEGCLGIGGAFADRTDDPAHPGKTVHAITGSPTAFDSFMQETADYEEIDIEVIDAFTATIAA